MKLTKAKHDEKQKNNYKKYEDAAKIVKSFERILWSDKLSGNNRKNRKFFLTLNFFFLFFLLQPFEPSIAHWRVFSEADAVARTVHLTFNKI